MPELPDLQVFSRNLNKMLKGKAVKKVSIADSKRLNVKSGELTDILEGQMVKEVYREGKELRFLFDNGATVGMHLMLHGRLYLFEKNNTHAHAIFSLLFDDDSGIVLADYQRMASVTLNPPEKDAPDALSDKLTITYLKNRLSGTRAAIKNVLLDQHIIRGIGNAYADEILWDAGISPFSVSSKIPEPKIKALVKSIDKVLKNAEKKILKSHPDIINGEVRDFMDIHNAHKKESPTGAKILISKTGARKTYYTEEQELFR